MDNAAVSVSDPVERWPTSRDLPYSDGVPLDNWWHSPAINLLVETIEYHWRDRKDFFVGGDMFMYFSPERVFNKDFRGPDFFAVKEVDHDKKRLSWVAWEENGQLPAVIIELASETTVHIDRGLKKVVYAERMHVPEYFVYDPLTDKLEGWRLQADSRYGEPIAPGPHGRLWCEELELYLGTWDGVYLGHDERWLRWYSSRGIIVPTFGEAGFAKAERMKAKLEQEKARADTAKAEISRLQAELAALRNQPRQS